jgi:hypothetical protein
MDIDVVRDPKWLPFASDGEHEIIHAILCDDDNIDPLDTRISLTLLTSDDRRLRLRLPADDLQRLAHAILSLGAEREWRDSPLRWRNEP